MSAATWVVRRAVGAAGLRARPSQIPLIRQAPTSFLPRGSQFTQFRGFAKRLTNRRIDLAVRKKKPLEDAHEGEVEPLVGEPYTEPTFQTWVHNMKGERISIIPLPADVFDQEIRTDILHRNVTYLMNKERGWSNAKTLRRSEISGTTKKAYRQKGTGRARMGTKRAPHHRGGGKAHGPVPRDFATKLNKKVRKLGKKIALAARYQEDNFIVIDQLSLLEPKTAAADRFMKLWGWDSVLFITGEAKDRNFELACRNLPGVETTTSLRFDVKKALLKEKLVFSLPGLLELQAHLLDQAPVRSAVAQDAEEKKEQQQSA